MTEANHFEALMQDKHKGFEADDRIEQAYRQGYENGLAQIEEKHWSECRQISAYEAENKRLKELLIRAFRLLKRSADPATVIWTEHYEFEVMNLINGKESE